MRERKGSLNMRIDYLKNYPMLVKEIAACFYSEWHYLYPQRSLKDFEDSIIGRLRDDRIPLSLVAVQDDKFLGTISLKQYDMDTRKDLTPWLAGLYVKKEFRNQGLGKKLIEKLFKVANQLEIKKLYLFTPSARGYYEKLGWRTVSEEEYQGANVTVMEKEVSSS